MGQRAGEVSEAEHRQREVRTFADGGALSGHGRERSPAIGIRVVNLDAASRLLGGFGVTAHVKQRASHRPARFALRARVVEFVAKPDLALEVWLDGKRHKEVAINRDNLFTFDNQFVLTGDGVTAGKHTLELRKKGTGPVYFNAYLTNFTLENFITKAGLEVKVNRKFYKLTNVDQRVDVAGSKGQALKQKVEKFERTELPNLATIKSGDLIEIELEIDSKNDYEYLMFEDLKAAGFEPVEVRSGYTGNELGAYVEFRDERVCFFTRTLARGQHSISYRLRAEIPGKFSALPTRASAMYAPNCEPIQTS
jgi:hypothetical protein